MTEKKIKRNHLPVRLNILFFLVFILFSALILRLGVVQIVQGEEYQELLERTINVSVPVEAPRGLIYDRFGNVLVDNKRLFTVTYTNRRTPQSEMLETARKLNEYITLVPNRINDRDKREYWSLLFPEEYEEKLSLEDARELELTDREAHVERLNRITESELDWLTEEDMDVFALWREFNAGFNNLPHKVMVDITYEEAARIMENLEDLPGVDIISDSERKYLYGDTLRGVFGSVGSIPRDDIDFYLANGYERNEEVGRSYLEAQYESVLRGRKGRLENFLDQNGNFLQNPKEHQGSRGNDLILTIDMELQQRVDQILEDRVREFENSFVGTPDAYVVVMEPHTGDILAMSGYGSGINTDIGTFTRAYEMGSAMKGATVLAGFDTGVIAPYQSVLDRTLNLPSAPSISSWTTLGYVNHLTALERSSNIYMVEVAMRLIGYIPGVSGTGWGNLNRGYEILRSYYHQFGLGVKTEIDLPNETAGIPGGSSREEPGRLLFLSFGQLDTYTPMQLAQYVSTIANGGYRIAPRVVKEIREPGREREELGPISQQMKPRVLNKLDVSDEHLEEVQRGFRLVTQGNRGTAREFFRNKPYDVAGKTGTAQVTVDGQRANNQTFVAYAPFDNPEVAIAVVVPGLRTTQSGVANRISADVLDAYFDLKERRNGPMNWEEIYEELGEDS
ncbi:cell division protein FtsI/penicillin-binding protein 2 [Evansella vedderi]|uniref:serine-type D-Ala-D-Ala carboxypeptidase n=1 Tax=Evansella vedderi TaxID=38282 RepID=A0ABT9ZTY6_9BACI|nr:penicillin-binding transpeptidase domain-containing protein [Evansella vedderi]MDQ0254405.1 cell division protein FtsI/penicillin-binding protein 2 [Evansella vedderi]